MTDPRLPVLMTTDYLYYRDHNQSFEEYWRTMAPALVIWKQGSARVQTVLGQLVSGILLAARVNAVRGARSQQKTISRPILSRDRAWLWLLAPTPRSDSTFPGKHLMPEWRELQVIGVAPPGFHWSLCGLGAGLLGHPLRWSTNHKGQRKDLAIGTHIRS